MTDQIDSHYHMRIAPRAVFEAEASEMLKEIAGTAAGGFVLWDPSELDLIVITGDDIEDMKEAYNEANPAAIRVYEGRGMTP